MVKRNRLLEAKNMAQILVVEDDSKLNETVCEHLSQKGHQV